ncbi:MAG: hypothetical protein M1840_003082 [Geoglossum simile]|nr:MAG: hypothetical protein M1840_003082 [Geoglossum simile]
MATISGSGSSNRTGFITIYKPTHGGTPEPLSSRGPLLTPSPSISSISPPVAIRRDTIESRLDQLVARIESIILSDSHDYSQTFIPVETVDLFERCKERLLTHPNPTVAEEFDTKLFYEYDAKLGQMIITYETHHHERISRILLCVVKAVEQSASVPSGWAEELVDDNSPTIRLEHNGYSGDFKPDGGLSYEDRSTTVPVLVVEVAHSQTEGELLRAGRRWLKGSGGFVRTVILLKLNYPAPVTNIRIWVLRLRTAGDEFNIHYCWNGCNDKCCGRENPASSRRGE